MLKKTKRSENENEKNIIQSLKYKQTLHEIFFELNHNICVI